MNVTTVGIDLAKNVFQAHGVDARGKVVLRRQLRREQVAAFFGNLPPCLIGMAACASAHHWGRTLERFGHTVRLMAPQFVRAYLKMSKNDAADAEAICEAVSRPSMRFVPIKSIEQQAVLSVHRVRQGFVKARTAQANHGRLGSDWLEHYRNSYWECAWTHRQRKSGRQSAMVLVPRGALFGFGSRPGALAHR